MERNLVRLKANGDRDDRLFVTFRRACEVAYAPDTTRINLFLTFERRFRKVLTSAPTAERSRHALEVFKDIHDDHRVFLRPSTH